MNVVIIGSSLLSLQLIEQLDKKAHKKIYVVVPNKDEALRLSSDNNIIVMQNDLDSLDFLDSIDLLTIDVFVAAMKEEETNILYALYAKNKGVRSVYARTESPAPTKILESMGVVALNPEIYAAQHLALRINRPQISEIVDLDRGEYNFIELPAKDFKNLIGKTLSTITGDYYVILGFSDDDGVHFSSGKKIDSESKILAIIRKGKEKEFTSELKSL